MTPLSLFKSPVSQSPLPSSFVTPPQSAGHTPEPLAKFDPNSPIKPKPFKPTKRPKRLSLSLATLISTGLHVVGPPVLVLLSALLLLLLSWLFNRDLFSWLWPHHQTKKPDVEFVLVKPSEASEPKEAKFVGEFNQEAGGAVDDQPPAPLEASAEQVVQQPVKQSQSQATQSPPSSQLKKPEQPKKPEKPVTVSTASKKEPLPLSPLPDKPVGQSAPQASSSQTSGLNGQGAEATPGNPQQGSAANNGVAVKKADFAPFMTELKRRLTKNWHPPRGDESRKVVVRFEVGREGQLLDVQIDKSSGIPDADTAAIEAVKVSAPFRTLPPEFNGDRVPVLFTFDYTVYGRKSL